MADATPRRRTAGQAATAAGAIVAAFALAAGGGVPASANPPAVPTWEEVQAAQRDEASKKAEIAKIERLITSLQRRAEELGKEAMLRAEDALLAQSELEAAQAKTARLASQLADAEARATASATLAASIVTRTARTGGGGDLAALLAVSSSADADRLLSRLGTMEKLSSTSAGLIEQALFDKRNVSTLSAEAKLAQEERATRADAAAAAHEQAEAAAAQVAAEVEAQAADIDVLYQQLAMLSGTTAELIREYYEGIVVTPPVTGPGTPTNPPTSPSPSPSPSPSNPAPSPSPSNPAPSPSPTQPPATTYPTPNQNAVNGAIAFAREQLGERYQLGGRGPDVWDCSGLTMTSYASVGVYIGTHSSTDQYNYMKRQGRLVPYSHVLPGDLIFYSDGGSADNPRKYHVTMYVGGGKMIEAPNPSAPVRIVNVRNSDRVAFVGRPTG